MCAATGSLICVNGATQNTCTPGAATGTDANCNGLDEDWRRCGGQTTTAGHCDLGVARVCARRRSLICVNGATQNNCTPGAATGTDQNCNGLDEDCDGAADNHDLATATSRGQGVCAAAGQLVCSSGATHDTCAPGAPTGTDANCNGLDEDCDGTVDNHWVSTPTTCGWGLRTTGSFSCVAGAVVNSVRPGRQLPRIGPATASTTTATASRTRVTSP